MIFLELIKRLDILYLKRRAMLQKSASDAGLYLGQLPIMEYIIENNDCSQVEIADALYLSPASVAISTKRLQKAGMLDKRVDKTSLRAKKLSITDKGRKIAEKCRNAFDCLDRRFFDGFSESELAQLNDYLDRLIANISDDMDKGCGINFYEMVSMENQLQKSIKSEK